MPEKDGVVSALVTDAKPGDDLKFEVAGTGDFPRDTQAADEGATAGNAAPRPGGGIGTPEGTPDPLHQYRFYILGGIAALLVVGGVYVVKRPVRTPGAAAASSNGSRAPSSPAATASRSSNLLEVLKEELFQLELDHHHGQLSDAEYERVKAALNVVIGRAVTRTAHKTSA
jgi:hypothetical protein